MEAKERDTEKYLLSYMCNFECSVSYMFGFILFYFCIFGWAGWVFSSCGEQGLLCSWGARVSHCGGFSYCRAWALGHTGFSSGGAQA